MLKILVAYHKKTTLFKNEIFIPIHLGRILKEKETKDGKVLREEYNWLIENMIGDDTGDNISDKNREYCELTGIYWACKNYDKLGNPDYIGFMHYRRLLVFNEYEYDKYEQTKINKAYRDIFDNFNNDNLLDKYGLNLETINKYIQKYDLILPMKSELKLVNVNNAREDYGTIIPGTDVKDYDEMVKCICENYPEYKDYILEQRETTRRYFYNIFVMRKDIFFDYCAFLFSVLEKLDKVIDTSNYSINGKRTLAYLGEALFDCYMRKLTNEANIKYKELGVLKIFENINEHKPDEIKENIFLGIKRSNKYFTLYLFGFRLTFKK